MMKGPQKNCSDNSSGLGDNKKKVGRIRKKWTAKLAVAGHRQPTIDQTRKPCPTFTGTAQLVRARCLVFKLGKSHPICGFL